MKIAITSLYLPSGSKIGVGHVVHYMADELTRRGHDVTVFSSCGPVDGALYRTVTVDSGSRARTFMFAWNLRRIDFTKFDVLHACGDDWFLWGTRRPRHIHTYMGSCYSEMLHARSLTAKTRMGALAICEYTSCFLANELVAISENTCRDIPRVKRVIPCGVDMKVFKPGASKSEVPSLLFVGTMHGRKRGEMLLDIFRREVRPKVPGAEFWAVCENPLEERDGVRWFGRVSTEKLAELYQRAWVFCLPSTYEGFGVPYIEAMASGTPVVATENVGAREVLQEGRFGAVVRDEELGAMLIRALTDDVWRRETREAGLGRATDFSWDTICAQYERLYEGSPTPATGVRV